MNKPKTEWGALMLAWGIMSADEVTEAEAAGCGSPGNDPAAPPVSKDVLDLLDRFRKGEISTDAVREKMGLGQISETTYAEDALIELFNILIPQAMPWTGTAREKAMFASGMLAPHARGLQRLLANSAATAKRDAERIVQLRKWLLVIQKQYPKETAVAVEQAIAADDAAVEGTSST